MKNDCIACNALGTICHPCRTKGRNICIDDVIISKSLQDKEPKLQDYRHIYLYAKGHYVKGDIIEDLKVILGEYYMLEPQYVGDEEVFTVLLTINYQHNNEEQYVKLLLETFGIRKMFPDQPHEVKDGIAKLLSGIRHVKIYSDNKQLHKVINLGEADPKILPLKEK